MEEFRSLKGARIRKGMSIKEFVDELERGGFTAKRIKEAVDIYRLMLKDKKCYKFVTAAGALIAGGLRNTFVEFIRAGAVDSLVLTSAIVTHDLIESFGARHYQGSLERDDSKLNEEGIFRMYDVFLEKDGFSKLEEGLRDLLPRLPQRKMSPREFLKELGKVIDDKDSILKACYDKGVDIYCPAFTDSMMGFHVWMYSQDKELEVNSQLDIGDFVERVWKKNRKAGLLSLGGGVPKNFVLGMMHATGNALDYIIHITSDRAEHGGASGMQAVEAKSWGKVKKDAEVTEVRCDVTLAFPLVVAALLDEIE